MQRRYFLVYAPPPKRFSQVAVCREESFATQEEAEQWRDAEWPVAEVIEAADADAAISAATGLPVPDPAEMHVVTSSSTPAGEPITVASLRFD